MKLLDPALVQKELIVKTSRSGGAGGQHVNKVETRVIVLWDFWSSNLLSQEEKIAVQNKLSNRLQGSGFLQIDVSESRSQFTNKELAIKKIIHLVQRALIPVKKRVPTKVPRAKIVARLDRKSKHGAKKSNRRWRMD